MIFKFIKWVDRKMFPMPTAQDYMAATLAIAELELAKAQNDADYANAQIAYRRAQVERITKSLNLQRPADGSIGGKS